MLIIPQWKKKKKNKADGDVSQIVLQKASTVQFSFPVPR